MVKAARFSVSTNPILLKKYDALIKDKGYQKRSDAVTDLLRGYIKHYDKKEIYATISIYYNSKENSKVPLIEQGYPCLVLSNMKCNIDNNNVIETIVLKGTKNRINKFFKGLKTLRGINNALLDFKN